MPDVLIVFPIACNGGHAAARASKGKLYSFTVVRRAATRLFADPYVLAIVELEEGPRMTTNIVAPPETLKVDMPVTVWFDDVAPEHTLVKFKPAT